MRLGVWTLLIAMFGALGGARAEDAPTPPFSARPKLGLTGAQTRLTVSVTDGRAWLQVGKARVDLGLAGQPKVALHEVALSGGGHVAVLNATLGDSEVAAIVSRPRGSRGEVLWSGRVSPHGDPGERIAHRIEVGDRDGDGVADVLLGETHERVKLCGERDTLINPRAVDPKSLRLRAVSIDRATGTADAPQPTDVTATTQSPGPAGAPALRLLLPVAASSTRGFAQPSDAGPPVAVADGDPKTAWHEGGAGGGRGEFVTLRWDSDEWPLRTVAVTFATEGELPAVPPVDTLLLRVDGGTRLRVAIPQQPVAPGTRFWIALPAPTKTRCVSVLFTTASRKGTRLGLVEVDGYGLDGGDGVATLVAELVAGGRRSAEATRLLTRSGSAALDALGKAWEKMAPGSKVRALRVAQAMPTEPSAIELFARAGEDAHEDVRAACLDGLVKAGDAAAEARAAILRTRGIGDQLALMLARRGGVAQVDVLLQAFHGSADASRSGLREALGVAVRRHGSVAAQRLQQWRADPHPPEVRAAVAQAIAAVAEVVGETSALVAEGLSPELEFGPLWRFILAAGPLPAEAEVDAQLATLARQDERWMIRAEALRSLSSRHGAELEGVARELLLDPYPRVRAAAVRSLATLGAATDLLAKHARLDRWFLVRVATMEAMGESAQEREAMRSGVDDRVPVVRMAAIAGLQRVGDAAAWPVVAPHVENDSEDPQVIGAGVTFARTLCIKKAASALRAVVERGLKPDAWDPDRELALHGLLALQHLEGRGAVQSLISRAGPDVVRALESRGTAAETGGCSAQK